MHDVLVVGGGPVGGEVARRISMRGHEVLLVEEHDRVGEPVQCAGLFTPRIFDLVEVPLPRVRRNEIRGAHVRSPSGRTIALDGGRTMAVAVDRGEFDRAVVESAQKRGAELLLGWKAIDALREGSQVVVTLRNSKTGEVREERTRILVGADGVQSSVAKWFGLPRAKEIIPCYGAEMEGVALDPKNVEIFVGERRAPGFFSWIIPTSPDGTTGKVEVGVSLKAPLPAKEYWKRMFDDPVSAPFLKNSRVCFEICGCIPLGPLRRTTTDGVMLVGDAAAQTKPTSGGGVYMGLVAAGILSEVASEALEYGETSDSLLSRYHDRWSSAIGRELRIGWYLRRAFMGLRDEEIEELFERVGDPEILSTIQLLGDIDYPSKLAKELLKKAPELFRFAGPALRGLLESFR